VHRGRDALGALRQVTVVVVGRVERQRRAQKGHQAVAQDVGVFFGSSSMVVVTVIVVVVVVVVVVVAVVAECAELKNDLK